MVRRIAREYSSFQFINKNNTAVMVDTRTSGGRRREDMDLCEIVH